MLAWWYSMSLSTRASTQPRRSREEDQRALFSAAITSRSWQIVSWIFVPRSPPCSPGSFRDLPCSGAAFLQRPRQEQEAHRGEALPDVCRDEDVAPHTGRYGTLSVWFSYGIIRKANGEPDMCVESNPGQGLVVGAGYYVLDRLADPNEVVTLIGEVSGDIEIAVVRGGRGIEYAVAPQHLSTIPASVVYRQFRTAAWK